MWDMYEQSRSMDDHRVQELYSDEDDLALVRGLRLKRSDDSFLQHSNIRSGRYSAQSSDEHLAYGRRFESSEDEDDDSEEHGRPQRSVLRAQEEMLAQRAQERIRKAKAKGMPTVNLTHEELDALERRFAAEPAERERKKSAGSSTKGSPNRNGAWTRKRSTSRPVSIATPTKSRSKGPKRKGDGPAADEAYTSGAAPPGVIPGPNGALPFSPLGYYNAQPAPTRRRDESRGSSVSSRYSGPPPTSMQYPLDTSQHRQARLSNASDFRPTSSSSRASSSTYFSEADYWSRSRSSSAAAPYPTEGGIPLPGYPSYGYPAGAGAPPGRRVVSGPPDVNYPHVYRRPLPPNQPARGRPPQSSSDPALGNRASTLSEEYGGSSSEEEDGRVEYERRPVAREVSQDRRSRK